MCGYVLIMKRMWWPHEKPGLRNRALQAKVTVAVVLDKGTSVPLASEAPTTTSLPI